MKIIYLNDEKWNYYENLAIAIGNFDGLHKGHCRLIDETLKDKRYKSGLITFNPHPQVFFKKDNFNTLLSNAENIKLIEEKKLDFLFIVKFDEKFANLAPIEFIKKLINLGVKKVILGEDARFGKNATGNLNDLKMHFEVTQVKSLYHENLKISTSTIKMMLENGNLKDANTLLGYNYFINGYIEHGNKVGRTLGFPTANINYGNHTFLNNGVYFVKIKIKEKFHFGICNVGNNPTINYSKIKKMEVFILNYDEIIYNENVKVVFIERLRDEIKFDSKEKLIEKMNEDIKITKKMIEKLKI